MATPIEVFLSYARKDEELAQELENHLSILQRQGLVSYWHDREITPGADWAAEINRYLNRAQLILLLISPDFMASDYSNSAEIQRAMEKHEAGEARVIPIILRPTYWRDWRDAPFGKLQALPKNGKPITTWPSHDLAFLDVAGGIRQAVEEVAANPAASLKSSIFKQIPANLETSASKRLEELANDLRKSYSYIRGYEDIIRISDDPREKVQAQQSIEKQGIIARHYLSEYQKLANQLGVRIPADITQISAHLGDMEYRAIS